MENYDELVRLVTEQVLAVLAGREDPDGPRNEGREKLLVIGDSSLLSQEMTRDRVVCTVEDYKQHQNIRRYRLVAVTRLSLTELADIAQGRDAGVNQCAVIQALLQGVDVYLYEEALPHRVHAGKGSGVFYAMLENYVRTLRTFGVKPADRRPRETLAPAVKPARFLAPPPEVPAGSAVPNSQRLITEETARAMVAGGGQVLIPRGAIVTPAAWDVFNQGLAEVEREGEL